MTDARNYRVIDKLKDGTPVTVRAIRPDDKNRIVEAFKNLDPESIYSRFFYRKRDLTDEDLKIITEVDFENAVALVLTIPAGDRGETIIGVGRYIMYNSSDALRSAEIAFTVEEDYQGQGIASGLLRHLIGIAREKGVSRFEADVLSENRAMVAVFAHSGLPIKQSLETGVVHVSLSLTAQGP
jgi:RimJ/RimL family protein N-acetyltransferase